MIIDAVQLPEDIERGAQGGPLFNTAILQADGGAETANVNWVYPRMQWNVGYGIQDKSGLNAVIAMFYARRGMARGFLFKDWSDYEIDNEQFGTGTGALSTFQMYHIYPDTVLPFQRKITRPLITALVGSVSVSGVPLVYGAGAGKFTVSPTTGIVTFGTPPALAAPLTATCEFLTPVRFAVDQLSIQMEWELVASIPSIPIIEVRE